MELPPDCDDFYGTRSSISLLDLLPMFMTLSATKVGQANWNINSTWMNLAAELILQAALEQYLVFGAAGAEPLEAAFAWGWTKLENIESDEASEEFKVNEMFRDEEGQFEIPEWTRIRREYMKLLATGEEIAIGCLMKAAVLHPLEEFEETMISFLEGMLKSLRQPTLVQMEMGKLELMSRTETNAFKARLGWD